MSPLSKELSSIEEVEADEDELKIINDFTNNSAKFVY